MNRALVFAFVAVVVLVVLDQWSKAAVFEWLVPPPPDLTVDMHGHRRFPLVGEWLAFMTTSNKGAAFGQFGQFPHVLVGGRILAVGLLSWLLVKAHPRHPVAEGADESPQPGSRSHFWISIAMTLVLAGAIGNLIDNLWTGAIEPDHPYFGVRDFIDVWFKPIFGWDYHFPSFNVADSCISVGAVLWILSGLFHSPRKDAAESAGEAADPAG